MASTFDATAYYVIFNTVAGSNLSLSLGYDDPLNPRLDTRSYSSENWQLFYDDGVYFIRNYDFEDAQQLGLDANDLSIPRMRNSTSELGMQWKITGGATSGTYVLSNVLAGSSNFLGTTTETNGTIDAVMNTDQTNGQWIMSKNYGATTVTNTAMLATYASIQSTSTTSTQTTSATASSTSSAVTTSSNSISGGAIAGIVIGSIAAITILLLLIFFGLRHRRKSQQTQYGPSAEAHQEYAEPVVTQPLMSQHPVELHGKDRRIELEALSTRNNEVSELSAD